MRDERFSKPPSELTEIAFGLGGSGVHTKLRMTQEALDDIGQQMSEKAQAADEAISPRSLKEWATELIPYAILVGLFIAGLSGSGAGQELLRKIAGE